MKSIDISEANASLREFARNLSQEPLLVTESGRTVAALLPIEDDDVDTLSLASNPHFLSILEKAREQRRAGQSLSSEDVRRELGLNRS